MSRKLWLHMDSARLSVFLYGIVIALLCCRAFRSSPSIDECGHLAAGLSHCQHGTFHLYKVNPPLVRTCALLIPSLLAEYEVPDTNGPPESRREFEFGKWLFNVDPETSLTQLRVGRFFNIALVLLLSLIYKNWLDSPLDAPSISRAATILSLFSPQILASAGMITPDLGAALSGGIAMLQFRRWLQRPSGERSLLLAFSATFAFLCKFTWCVVLPCAFLISWVVFRITEKNENPEPRISYRQLSLVVVVCLFTINSFYLFDGSFSQLGDIRFVSKLLTGESSPSALPNRFSTSVGHAIPVPLPRLYVQGIDLQKLDFERGFRSYLMGEWKKGGWWYYYLVGFLVKEPIGFQLMLYISILNGLYHWKHWTKHSIREWSFIVLPPLLIFGLVSSQTGFNHHMRYVLPAYPFLFIIAARTVTLGKFWKWFSYGCMTWQVVAVLWFAPHWMSYFNEAAGGPKNGHDWLVDSNIDWGQDILGLKWWQDEHPEVDLQAALFTGFDPADIGLKFRLPAPYLQGQPDVVSKDGLRGPQAGWYAVSVCQLKGHSFSVPNGEGGWEWSMATSRISWSTLNRWT